MRFVRSRMFFAGSLLIARWVSRLSSSSRRSPEGAGGPTFAADIAPIVYAHCSTCHRPGQAAPFSLLSYEDVKRRATLIVTATCTSIHAAVARDAGTRIS